MCQNLLNRIDPCILPNAHELLLFQGIFVYLGCCGIEKMLTHSLPLQGQGNRVPQQVCPCTTVDAHVTRSIFLKETNKNLYASFSQPFRAREAPNNKIKNV